MVPKSTASKKLLFVSIPLLMTGLILSWSFLDGQEFAYTLTGISVTALLLLLYQSSTSGLKSSGDQYLTRQADIATGDFEKVEAVAQVGHWSAYRESDEVIWSPGMFAIYGQDADVFVPTHTAVMDCFIPEDRDLFQTDLRRMMDEGQGVKLESQILRPDGAKRHVSIIGTIEKDQSDQTIGVFGVTQDITDKKNIELALRRSEERLDLAIEATGAATWDMDLVADTLSVSPRLAETLGFDPDEWVLNMETFERHCHPDDLQRVRDTFSAHINNSAPFDVDYRMSRSDNEYIWVQSRGRAIRDDGGRVIRIVGTISDITSRKAEQELHRRNEETLQLAIQASQAGYFSREWNEEHIYWSPKLYQLLGIAEGQSSPHLLSFMDLVHPEDRETLRADVTAFQKSGASLDLECRVKHADGHYIWVQLRAMMQHGESGQPLRSVGFVIDITDRKVTQIEIEDTKDKLELALQAAGAGYYDYNWIEDSIEWSERTYEILGLPKKLVPKLRTFNELLHPEDSDLVDHSSVALRESGVPFDVEARVKHASGDYIWMRIQATQITNEFGIPVRTIGYLIDITDRKLANLETEQTKEKLELALEASRAGYFDHHWIDDTVEWSARTYEILGLPSSFVPKSRTFNGLVHPEDAIAFEQRADELRESGGSFDLELRVQHASGRYIWMSLQAVQFSNSDGVPVRTTGFVTDISARKNLELELEARKQMFEDVATAAGEYIWEFDRQGIFTFVSDRVEDVLGHPAEEVIGRSPAEFMNPGHAKKFRVELIKLMKVKEGFKGFEVPGFRSDGSIVWQQLSGTPVLDVEDKVSGYRGVSRDITTQKEAEQAVVRSEGKFRDLIEGSIQGLVIHRKYKPLFINDAYARMIGYANGSEMMEKVDSMLRVLPEEFRDGADAFWDKSISGALDGEILRGKVIDKDGVAVWTDAIGRVVVWDDEPAFQITVIDVTKAYKSELALRESEERFRVVAENASDLITIRGPSGNLSYASPSAVAITGYQPQELIDSPPGSMAYEDDLPALEQRRAERTAGTSNDDSTLLWRMRRKDGRLIWLETSSSTLPPPEGEDGHRVLSLSRDVTERVERERELEAARDRLARQASELSDLAVRLEDERKRAEEANVAKSQFLAMMSHELRTPMTGVLGMVDLLNKTEVTQSQQDMLDTLKRSASALLELLNDVLDFSKIEAGEFDLEVVDFRLSSLLKDVQQLFEPVLLAKGLELELSVAQDTQDVLRGDPTRLRQVLLNLIGNAHKFTENGKVTLRVNQDVSFSGDITLRFDVVDTGIGIAPEEQHRLFQAFVQAEANTTRKFGGTGLGLAICKQLVEAMGGVIWVDSELGKGSTFTFTLPTSVGDPALAEQFESDQLKEEIKLKPMRVLVAEDNPTTQMLVKSMLEREGHTVVVVENGALAVEAAEREDFEIILMDMQMPVMDGPDATRQIRGMSGAIAKCPIIALTADAIRSHRQTYLDAGANVIVTKPISWTTLFSEIGRLTGQVDDSAIERNSELEPSLADELEEDSHDGYQDYQLMDATMLDALSDALDEQTLSPMLSTFKDNMTKYVDELYDLLTQGDIPQSERTAHALKGLAAQFGAARVSAIAKTIEEDGLELGDLERLMPVLRRTVEETISVFDQRV